LAGKEFEAIFVFNTLLGNLTSGPTVSPSGGTFVELLGGTGTPTPLVKATLSVAGSSPVTIKGGQEDRTVVRTFALPTANSFQTSTVGLDSLFALLQSTSTVFPDLTTIGEYLASTGGPPSEGQFSISGKANGFLSFQKLVVSNADTTAEPPPSEIPLPAALPLFATGVAAVAYAGRKKRKAKAAQSAA
jgi:hypothetical protein